MTRFELVFTESPDPELLETRFYHPAIGTERRCRRGRITTNCFTWSAGVQAMALLVLKSVEYSRKNQDRAVIRGGGGSPAATLDYALSKQPNWMLDMFGMTAGGTPAVTRMFSRVNPERKRPGPVEISLNTIFLPIEGIKLLTGDSPLSDTSLEQILRKLESRADASLDTGELAASSGAIAEDNEIIAEPARPASFGIDPLLAALSPEAANRLAANFAKAAVHPALKNSVEAFSDFLNRDPEPAIQACLSDRYFIGEVPYTHLDGGFVNVQQRLKELVIDCSLGQPSAFGRPDYGSILEKIGERRLRVLYLFPFFLIPSRRRLFGALQYARHHSVGILIHRDHSAYPRRLRRVSQESNPLRLPSIADADSTHTADARWISEAVRATEQNGGVITWTDGYVYYDLVSEMLQDSDPAAANALHSRQLATDVKEVPELYFTLSPSSHWHRELATPKSSIHLFDPGEAELLRPRLAPGMGAGNLQSQSRYSSRGWLHIADASVSPRRRCLGANSLGSKETLRCIRIGPFPARGQFSVNLAILLFRGRPRFPKRMKY